MAIYKYYQVLYNNFKQNYSLIKILEIFSRLDYKRNTQ